MDQTYEGLILHLETEADRVNEGMGNWLKIGRSLELSNSFILACNNLSIWDILTNINRFNKLLEMDLTGITIMFEFPHSIQSCSYMSQTTMTMDGDIKWLSIGR